MLLHALHGALLLKFAFRHYDTERRRLVVQWWLDKVLRIAGITVQLEGEPPAAGAMVAANHVSWLDICVIAHAYPTRFVAKSEIRDWPGVGWIAERAGTIFLKREQRRDMGRTNQRMVEMMAAGDCVGLFPEGTTSEGDTLLRFHSSLFEPAVAHGARVHPCAIRYQRLDGSLCREVSFVGEVSFPQSLGLVLRQRDVVARLRFPTPIECSGQTRREVARACRDAIEASLGISPGTAPSTGSGPPA
jgi:1-acyl-sn-glycerol-3-phosphate acyltransferase